MRDFRLMDEVKSERDYNLNRMILLAGVFTNLEMFQGCPNVHGRVTSLT